MLHKVFQITQKIIAFVFILLAIVSIFSNLQVKAGDPTTAAAATAQNPGSFLGCDISTSAQGGNSIITSCLRSITTFILVVGIIAGGVNFAVFTLRSYVPGQNSDTFKDARETIRNLIIGIILIGAPSLVLGILNSSALNLDFISGLCQLRGGTNCTAPTPPTPPTPPAPTPPPPTPIIGGLIYVYGSTLTPMVTTNGAATAVPMTYYVVLNPSTEINNSANFYYQKNNNKCTAPNLCNTSADTSANKRAVIFKNGTQITSSEYNSTYVTGSAIPGSVGNIITIQVENPSFY